MLGEIDFKAWQCLSEIIDNSIDAFSDEDSVEDGEKPTVKIKLPAASYNQLTADCTLEISDNGKGMDRASLGKSLSAGFSGNDPIDKMGLFGMGFNISTARLGSRTEVLTTTRDSDHYLKVTIDFQELEKLGHFLVPLEVVPKRADEQKKHGTIVRISKLRTEHYRPLYQQKRITTKLGKIYGRIIREKGIRLIYHGKRCKPFEHCIWSSTRLGQARAGTVPAVVEIDELIDEKQYCCTCWVWLSDREDTCSVCGESNAISKRQRRVKGWLGIQRYFSDAHYGIDLIRNGRVIRELDKSFFFWNNRSEDTDELEYPIDGHERKGRIVGELEIDFVKVTHQKDAFDTSSSDWQEVVRLVRGDAPIRPNIAKNAGYAENNTPLARLFSAFRGAKASIKNLVPQRRNGGAMITDAHIDELVRKFHDGEEGYYTDDKWWDLVTSQARDSIADDTSSDDPTGGNPFVGNDGDTEAEESESVSDSGFSSDSEKEKQILEPDKNLSGTYNLDLFTNVAIRVVAERAVDGSRDNGFSVIVRGAELTFVYWPKSSVFARSLLTPADFLINELAYQFHTTAQNELSTTPLTSIELALRDKYFPELHPTVMEIERQVQVVVDELKEHVASKLGQSSSYSPDVIDEQQLDIIRRKLAENEYLSADQIDVALNKGEFINHATFAAIGQILKAHPEIPFDGVFYSIKWSEEDSNGALINVLKKDFEQLIDEILWFQSNSVATTSSVWRGRIKRLIGIMEIVATWRTKS